ncbi:MAG TPA: hypothetical protein PL059_00590 [Spirochaetota bacterium]|nr:hypothetical protein [Spirochaetota bacterium]HPP48450.1 hypothetical protein [Spirochaetota bacterium]
MGLLSIMLLCIFYTILIVIVYEYYKLFNSKDEYTKQELKQVVFLIPDHWIPLLSKFRLYPVYALTSLVFGILIPLLSTNWFFQSSVLCILLFIILPQIRRSYEPMKVTVSDSFVDTVATALSEYYEIILFFFSTGTLSSLTYTWVTEKELSFLWFMVNAIIICIIMFFMLASLDKENI